MKNKYSAKVLDTKRIREPWMKVPYKETLYQVDVNGGLEEHWIDDSKVTVLEKFDDGTVLIETDDSVIACVQCDNEEDVPLELLVEEDDVDTDFSEDWDALKDEE